MLKRAKKGKQKKKTGKKILGLLMPILPILLVVIIIASGLLAVVSFVVNLVKGIGGIFDPWNGNVDAALKQYTLEEILDRVDDPKLLSEQALKEMMIDRASLKRLLEGVKKHNEEYDTDTKTLGCKHVWTTTYTDKAGMYIRFGTQASIR